ncbi:hypothetical protein F8388_016377 [Cannabis sativa]|uniref:Reverse transcriptase zinc-binding domain-containing protein n=1 Tax=Cannabis sativa TaxID=3483 RepID=A0A7J6GT96_CANSA|nr:hypothetical protein F8388_016377 [Cannabis sativa]
MENLVLQDSIINSRLCWLGLRQTCDSKTQLLTRDKLNRIMPIKDIKCPVCELKDESHDHVMFDCLFSKQLGQVTWPTSITDLCNMCFLARHDLQNRVETYVVIPSVVPVVDDRSTETTSWVNTGSGDGDGCQMDQEDSEPNRQRVEYYNINLLGRENLWRYAWRQWLRKRCRQGQRCQQSQHQGHHLLCNQRQRC